MVTTLTLRNCWTFLFQMFWNSECAIFSGCWQVWKKGMVQWHMFRVIALRKDFILFVFSQSLSLILLTFVTFLPCVVLLWILDWGISGRSFHLYFERGRVVICQNSEASCNYGVSYDLWLIINFSIPVSSLQHPPTVCPAISPVWGHFCACEMSYA